MSKLMLKCSLILLNNIQASLLDKNAAVLLLTALPVNSITRKQDT